MSGRRVRADEAPHPHHKTQEPPMKRPMHLLALAAAALAVNTAQAKIEITEWMYNGDEFIELTNMGSAPVNFAGWRYDDDSRNAAGGLDLSAFGMVGVGESVIIAEQSAAAFRASWNLGAEVKIIGGNSINLGRADEINIFDSSTSTVPVDRFTYGDEVFAGTIRANNISGNPMSVADLVPSTVTTGWALSSVGDTYGSYASLSNAAHIGNPGSFIFAPVPEPETYALMLAGLGLVGTLARRRRTA